MVKQYPRVMIDDTSCISDARVFVAHMKEPRFVGELMPDEEHDIEGISFACPCGQTLCRIEWLADPAAISEAEFVEITRALNDAIEHHHLAREGGG